MRTQLRSSLKFIGFAAYATRFICEGTLNRLLARSEIDRRQRAMELIQSTSIKTLKLMGVQVVLKDQHPEQPYQLGQMVACNHVGYLDVLILASQFPGVFVTSVEVRETPFLGLLAQIGGCLFVERRSREGLSAEVRELTTALRQGFSVLFFPEATSTNADQVLRFRRPLFQAAIDAQTEILPLTLNYISVSGRLFQRANRDTVCWYGDMPFLSHLLNLFGQTEVTALITKHEQISAVAQTKESLAEVCHEVVAGHFVPCPSRIDSTAFSSRGFSSDCTDAAIDSAVSPA